MEDFWGTVRHSFTWYGWSLRFCITSVVMWISYELLALLERAFWPTGGTFNIAYDTPSQVARKRARKKAKQSLATN